MKLQNQTPLLRGELNSAENCWASSGLSLECVEEDGTVTILQEALRKRMACVLTSAINDGRLEQVLAARNTQEVDTTSPASSASYQPSLDGSSIEVLRRKAAASLFSALHDGRLERVLAARETREVDATPASLPSSRSLSPEALRQKVASVLAVAMNDGRLQQAVQDVQPESTLPTSLAPGQISSNNASLEALRQTVASSLISALNDGRLERALAGQRQQVDTRPRLSSVSSQPPSNDSSTEALRLKVASLMTSALNDGRLEQALAAEMTESPATSPHQVEPTLLASAPFHASPSASASEALRMRVACLLTCALNDGRLERALASQTRQVSRST
mmetsp:Transcript_56672/g.106346  ORF Transcript_56672/g.106346 Transcript_56672/m.106346 type:complete len:334 (-) Transcript_56672:244-1245(-)